MADLYTSFTFKSTGTALASDNDFVTASTGTQFQKSTGELYQKVSNGIFSKVSRNYFSTTEADARYVNVTGDSALSGNFTPTNDNNINIGSSGLRFANMYAVNFNGTATKALYADLAEIYSTDKEYVPGTVLEFGGSEETTLYNGGSLAGVVSTNPGLMMNEGAEGQYIALKGRVPVLAEGDIKKGQFCVAVPGGKVKAQDKENVQFLDFVGIAISDSQNGMVEVKI
jgi:hypothetical protein